jgi:double-stranded uracil-DNA glycosylase
LRPDEQEQLPGYGLGITNLAARGTARADELTIGELVAGGAVLEEKIREYRPGLVAVLGVGAYRSAFGDRTAAFGPQASRIGGAPVWVLPNPSGLNAHYTLDRLAAEFAKLREAVNR